MEKIFDKKIQEIIIREESKEIAEKTNITHIV